MQAEVDVRMVFCVGSDFREPGARHHDAGGSNRILIERVKAGGVHGMSHSKIIGVDDEEFRIGWIAQAFGYSLILGARCASGETQEQAGHGKILQAHRELQQSDLAVKRNMAIEAHKVAASSCAVICRVGVLWLEALFTIAAQMVYTQPCA